MNRTKGNPDRRAADGAAPLESGAPEAGPGPEKARITVIDYDEKSFLEKEAATVEECFPFRETSTVTWINVDGVRDREAVEKLGTHFGLHPLLLESITETSHRPKLEDTGDVLFLIARMMEFGQGEADVVTDQFSLIIGRNFLISFQERPGDDFEPVRERIRRGTGRIRKSGPDYLAYALLDAVVDHYFAILEKLGETVEDLEEELISDPRKETLHKIHILKREMIYLRKSVWPLREVLAGLERSESCLVQASTGVFLRDLYDHTIQVIDNVETFRDMLSGMLETYLSSVSNRMNEVMKVLTIISTIFIPLTFIVGVYGMNFVNLPELKWRHGYFLVWGIMISIGLVMIAFFRRKKWL